MNKEQSSKVAEAELDLNNALVNADISNGYEEYLALFDHFYDENVEVASDSNPDPLVGNARVLPIIFNFLMPLHVMAEIGGLSVRLRYTPLFSDKREEQHYITSCSRKPLSRNIPNKARSASEHAARKLASSSWR
jgi:hypothetical protein